MRGLPTPPPAREVGAPVLVESRAGWKTVSKVPSPLANTGRVVALGSSVTGLEFGETELDPREALYQLNNQLNFKEVQLNNTFLLS